MNPIDNTIETKKIKILYKKQKYNINITNNPPINSPPNSWDERLNYRNNHLFINLSNNLKNIYLKNK